MEYVAFKQLWQNVNRIAEGSLQQFAEKLLQDADASPRPSVDEQAALEAQAVAHLKKLDVTEMMDCLPWGIGDGAPVFSGPGQSSFNNNGHEDMPQDFDHRIRRLMTLADHEKIESMLANLPRDLPLLTEALDPQSFEHWVKGYTRGNRELEELCSYLFALSSQAR